MKPSVTPIIALLAIIFLFDSCATILSGSKQEVRLNSSPAGAKVYINGKDVGLTTPCLTKIKRKAKATVVNNRNEYHYLFELEGYANGEFIDYRRINPQIYLNAFTWLFITITTPIDFISGASYKYQNYVTVNLYPVQNKQVITVNNDISKKEDKQPPTILILSPDLNRGFKLTVQEDFAEIKGIATDESGIFEVLVNGIPAKLNSDGSFNAQLSLMDGNNKITVVAKDKKMNTASESFYMECVPRGTNIAENDNPQPEVGKYHALIIGVQEYTDPSFADLDEPVNDAQKLYTTLLQYYQFDVSNVKLLKNPTRDEITQSLEYYFNTLTPKDNLLIFYAGHGFWDAKFSQGYWLPADAQFNNRGTWLSNGTIRDYMRAINCKHSLLITDACFAGGIFKSREAFPDASKAVNELYRLTSRKAMTSGALNEVPDKSVFLEYLIKRLAENDQKYLSSEQLFASFKLAVINNSTEDQVPQYGEVKETGDEGGDFIFIKK